MIVTRCESGLRQKDPFAFFKNFEPFCMNFRRFPNRVYEFWQFEDAMSIQISSVVIKILKKLPIYQNQG